MQTPQDTFFYHSNSRLGSEGGLENEKQLLVEEQKSCRARARKFSVETNRRRKALEERRKQLDVNEQRLMQNVLQQRRQRVQDATERFQRAHLPPSQRYRQPFKRNAPNIEDALSQIQSTLGFLSSHSNIGRSCTPSPKPPAVSKASHRLALSAVEAYTKLLQEQSMTCFKSSRETEDREAKQPDPSLQDSHLCDCSHSESLSSKDSLENEDPNHSPDALQCSHSPERPRPHLSSKQSHLLPPPGLTSLSALTLLDDDVPQSRKLHEPKQKNQDGVEGSHSRTRSSKASWGFASVEPKTPQTEANAALTLCETIGGAPKNVPNGDAIAANGDAAPRSPRSKQEALLDLRHHRVYDDRQLKPPSATEALWAAGSGKEVLFGVSPKPNIYVNDSTTDNTAQEVAVQETGRESRRPSSQAEPSASINNLNKVLNSEPRAEKPVSACCSKNLKPPEEDVQNPTPPPLSGVRLIKGILKKPSRYMPGECGCVYKAGHLSFAKEVAVAIRDSVELTRAKSKEGEGNKGGKKKLRWFDEEHVGQGDKKQSQDHQLSPAAVSGAWKPGPGVTPAASAGYHFTKQAWADVGVQVGMPQEQTGEVKAAWSGTRAAGPRAPRRERPAKAGAGPVSSRARKGTVMRPQSATEVSQIAKTQGRIIVPRPPPRMEWVEERTAPAARAPYGADPPGGAGGFLSPHTRLLVPTDSGVMYTLLPPSEGNAKGAAGPGQQDARGCSRRRGGAACGVTGPCLDCTPTDEEISRLWHGVRSALVAKEAKARQRPAAEGGRAARKAGPEQSRRFPQPAQTTEPVRAFHSGYSAAHPDPGLEGGGRSHLARAHAEGQPERVAAMETGQTWRPGSGRGTISLEEQKILLSLDRLNRQLFCVREHVGGGAGARGLAVVDGPPARDAKVANPQKQRAASASGRPRYHRKV